MLEARCLCSEEYRGNSCIGAAGKVGRVVSPSSSSSPARQDIHQHCGGSNNNAMSTNPLGMNNSTGEASVKAAAGEENAHGPANASSSSSDNSRQQQSNEVRRPLRNQSTTG